MNRRNFLSLFSAGIAGIALEQAIPLNRVWSFPKNIVIPKSPELLAFESVNVVIDEWQRDFAKEFRIGDAIQVRLPQRWIVRGSYMSYEPVRDFIVTKVEPDKISLIPEPRPVSRPSAS